MHETYIVYREIIYQFIKYYIYHYALSTILNISIDIFITSVFQHQKPFWRQQTVKNYKIPLPTTKKRRRRKKNKNKMKSSHSRWLILDYLLYLYFENFYDINQVGKKDLSWQYLIQTIEEYKTKGSIST